MSTISSGVGLVSGINTQQIIDALINAQHTAVDRLTQRSKGLQTESLGYDALSTTLLTLKSSATDLSETDNFNKLSVSTPDGSGLQVTAGDDAAAGSYQFRAVRQSSNHQVLSQGFSGADATFHAGTLTIATGGELQTSPTLDLLNGGAGVQRGTIRITDRTGTSAVVDLSSAQTADDVLQAINGANLAVKARVVGDHFELDDTSGSTAANLSVAELGGGHTAADLGLLQSIASDSLSGQSVYYASGNFTLAHINDGNALDLAAGLTDLKITHSGGSFEVDLDGAKTVNDILDKINTAAGGAVTASLSNGRIQLTDAGGGPLSVADINGASATRELGLDATAAGGTLTGRSLTGGLGSVLLRNLLGGKGITQLGSVQLTDRAGNSAVVDLSGAETLDDVIQAINGAETSGGVKLQLSAALDEVGTRLRITDTSGSTASHLVVADQNGGTLAAQFGIAVDADQTSVTSNTLDLRYISGNTRLDSFAPGGKAVALGSFHITDATGATSTVSVDSSVQTLDDLFTRIRAAASNVGVELYSTGDGFRLYSLSGSGDISVTEADSTTAADLGLLGTGTRDGNGVSQIVSRRAVQIDIAEGDTLSTVVDKINLSGAPVSASLLNDGTTLAPTHLALRSDQGGRAGRLVLDDGGLGLTLATQQEGKDALLQVGSGTSSFLLASATNTFQGALTGLDVTVTGSSSQAADVTVARDTSNVEKLVSDFVGNYNSVINAVQTLTSYDATKDQRAVLQGSGLVLRMTSRIGSVINAQTGAAGDLVRSLANLGVRLEDGGKLSLDSDRLQSVLQDDPDAVANFFAKRTTGLGDRLSKAIESFTDDFTGAFALQKNALKSSTDALNDRIDQLNAILDGRRQQLVQQFAQMEAALGTLQSQQQSIGKIAPVTT